MFHHIFNDKYYFIFVIVGDTMLMVKSVSPLQESTNSMEIRDDILPISVFILLSLYIYWLKIMLSNTGYESAVVYVCPVCIITQLDCISLTSVVNCHQIIHHVHWLCVVVIWSAANQFHVLVNQPIMLRWCMVSLASCFVYSCFYNSFRICDTDLFVFILL